MATSIMYITPANTLLDDGQQSPSLTFDAITTFSPTFNNDITSYPVSNKTVISNHRVRRNPTFTVEGWISTQPISTYDNNLVGYTQKLQRPQTVYNLLKAWDLSGIDLTLVYEYDVYNQCQIKSWEPVKEGSDSILIKITFEQVRRATYRRVTLVEGMSESKRLDAESNRGKSESNGTASKREWQVLRGMEDLGTYVDKIKTEVFAEDVEDVERIADVGDEVEGGG